MMGNHNTLHLQSQAKLICPMGKNCKRFDMETEMTILN